MGNCLVVAIDNVLVLAVKISRLSFAQGGQPFNLNKPGFHPAPICKRYGVGIPAELAKTVKW